MIFTLEDFYGLLKEAVRYYPTNARKCLQLQTFRVLGLDSAIELSAPNMGANTCERTTPYFYSRSWEQSAYNPNQVTTKLPALTAFDSNGTLRGVFSSNTKSEHRIVLTVWDAFNTEKHIDCEACEHRTVNMIHRDTKRLLLGVVRYLYAVKWCVIDDDKSGWYNVNLLNAMKSKGLIGGFTSSTPLQTKIEPLNKELSFTREQDTAMELHGTAFILTIPVNECFPDNYTFDNLPEDGKILSHEAGYKNCC